MFDTLTTYLESKVSLEKIALYSACYNNLEKFQVPEFDQILDNLVMDGLSGLKDTTATVDEIDVFFNTALHDVLNQHGVVLNEETPLELINLIVSSMLDLIEYENTDEIERTLKTELDSAEIFCELIHLVMYKTVDELMPYVDSVDVSLFSKLLLHIQNKEQEKSTESTLTVTEREKRISALKDLINNTQNYELLVIDFLGSGMDVGYPYETYVETIKNKLDFEDPDKVAENLYACALIAEDGFLKPRETVLATIDNYITVILVATKVNVRLTYLESVVKRNE